MFDSTNDPSPLIRAIAAGDQDRIIELLDSGHPVDDLDSHGRSALMCAIWEYNPDLVQLLIERGANVNYRSPYGSRPLLAHPNMPVKMTKMLLKAGADPQAAGVTGIPVIAEIAANSTKRVLETCFDCGVKLEIDPDTQQKLIKKLRGERSANLKLVLNHLGLEESKETRTPAPKKPKTDQIALTAASPEFKLVTEKIRKIFHRKESTWKRRAGVMRFHNVPIAEQLATYYSEALPLKNNFDEVDELLRRFVREIEQSGFLLIRNDFIADDRCTLLLFPSSEKYDVLHMIGTNGNNYGHSTHDVIVWLQKMEQKNPFRLIAATHDGMEGEFLNEVLGAQKLAEEMLEFCPDLQTTENDTAAFALELLNERASGFGGINTV
ncbi:MAG: DUF4253 domain-containing protein [Zavarzinella sp.]